MSDNRNKVLLIVDDDKSILDLISSFLVEKYKSSYIGDALEAVKKAKEENVDLLISDVRMPAMSGKELAQKVRKINPFVKILFISGNISDSVADKADVDPNIDYIEKPFSRKDLIEKIENLLNN